MDRYIVHEGDLIKCPKCGEYGIVTAAARSAKGGYVFRGLYVRHRPGVCFLAPVGEPVELEEPPLRLSRLRKLEEMVGEDADRLVTTIMRLSGLWYAAITSRNSRFKAAFKQAAEVAGLSDLSALIDLVEEGKVGKAYATRQVKAAIALLIAEAAGRLIKDRVKTAMAILAEAVE